jgi:S-adenosylmethionine hydrolase
VQAAIVTLLTDFGTTDTYVAQMKGVMLSVDPSLRLVDLTHAIPPQDILEGAFQLASAIDAFPTNTVHLAVVDPGVGSQRRAIAVRTNSGTLVGPDNGLFTFAYESRIEMIRELRNERIMRLPATTTFHGRDIFAPFAAAIAGGALDWDDVGPDVDPATLVRLDLAPSVYQDAMIRGSIVSIDRFGNCLTLIRLDRLPAGVAVVSVESGEFRASRLSRTYSDVSPGSPVALVGSFGTLELSERDGNAAARWSLKRGDAVVIRTAASTVPHCESRILSG